MPRKRSTSSSAAVALAIPLLLCLPHTLVTAFTIYDRIPSPLQAAESRNPRSLVRRDELSEFGFYNPLDYGGYMLTVSSSSSFLSSPPFNVLWLVALGAPP